MFKTEKENPLNGFVILWNFYINSAGVFKNATENRRIYNRHISLDEEPSEKQWLKRIWKNFCFHVYR